MIRDIAQKLYGTARKCALSVLKVRNTRNLVRNYDKVYGKGNYIALYPPQGMGDILACCCGVEYLDHKDKRVVVIVSKKYFADISAFFPSDYVTIVYVNKYLSDRSYKSFIALNSKVYFPEQPYISMKYNMCLAMGIPTEVIFHNQYKRREDLSDLSHIKANKTVLISPYATSCKDELDYNFWIELADRLKGMGYELIFNAPSDSYYAKNYKTCLLNLVDTVELVTKGGFFIGWRSGLCDIIGMYSKAKIFVIYPSNPNKSDYLFIPPGMSYPEAYMHSCSLKNLWSTEAFEIINNPDLLNQINNKFVEFE